MTLRSILIVGGGTAGWLTACYLAKTLHAAAPQSIQITLVESADIGILGVGEGTFPSLRGTLAAIGLDEAVFLRGATATFKQGIRFMNWVRPKGSAGNDHYFHPFSLPSQQADAPELLPYWLLGAAGDTPFAEAVTLQKRVVDAARAPKKAGDKPYQARLNYAYHFDAVKFAAVLAEHGRSLGVRHVIANVESAELDESGNIARVLTREAGALEADLFVDCTGFRAALIGKALGSPFKSAKDVLFVDRAVAMQVPYARADAPLASATISTAHEAGWTWDIGLQERRGVGYVYSTRHTSDARAEEVLRNYIGAAADTLTPRLLKFEAGHRPTQWIGNCVAVGLSAGFVEPLESTGIGLIEIAAYLIAHLMPDARIDGADRAPFQHADGRTFPAHLRFHQAALLHQPAPRFAILDRQYRCHQHSRFAEGSSGDVAPSSAASARFRHRYRNVPAGELALHSVRHGVPHRSRADAQRVSAYGTRAARDGDDPHHVHARDQRSSRSPRADRKPLRTPARERNGSPIHCRMTTLSMRG